MTENTNNIIGIACIYKYVMWNAKSGNGIDDGNSKTKNEVI